MVDPSVKEGIPLAQMVMNCDSEVMHCEVENANLCQWLTEESYKAYEVYYGAQVVDVDVAFFALLCIHELHGLQRSWMAKTEFVGAPPDVTKWVPLICPPLLEDLHPALQNVQPKNQHVGQSKVMTLKALMMMKVLWSWIGKRMLSLFFVRMVMAMHWNMIETLNYGMYMVL